MSTNAVLRMLAPTVLAVTNSAQGRYTRAATIFTAGIALNGIATRLARRR